MVLLEWIEKEERFKVVYREEVSRGEWTYTKAVDRIIEINEIFEPEHIYVDAGAGEHQIETLRGHGVKHPETNLHKRVKRVQFKESVKVMDPFENKLVKKPVKPFMVEQTQIVFQRDMIDINDDDKQMWKQLEDYIVVRVTDSGDPVFINKDEHIVDALLLCILGYTMNYPELVSIIQKRNLASKVGVIERQQKLDKVIKATTIASIDRNDTYDKAQRREELMTRSRSKRTGIGWASRGSPDFVPRRSRVF